MGYREINHTADRAIEVWGADMQSLFEDAARGMYSLMNIQPDHQETYQTQFSIQGKDDETILVAFLSELLYLVEEEKAIFNKITLKFDKSGLSSQLVGYKILSIDRIIKAVTFHNLEIRNSQDHYRVEIIFDV